MPADILPLSVPESALTIYHALLIRCRHSDLITKKDLLLLYMLRNRSIAKYQLSTILDYPLPLPHSADVFLNRLYLSGLVDRESRRTGVDIFSLTSEGLVVALQIFHKYVKVFIQSDFTFASTIVKLTSPSCSIEDCGRYLKHRLDIKKHPSSAVHQTVTNDSFLTLLSGMPVTAFLIPPFYECGYQYGSPISFRDYAERGGRYQSESVRSDAIFGINHSAGLLSLQYVLLEQDTRSQKSSVIKDKLQRYMNDVLTPWVFTTKQLPPILLFSLFTMSGRKDLPSISRRSTKSAYYLDGLCMFAEYYATTHHESLRSVTIDLLLHLLGGVNQTNSKQFLAFLQEIKAGYPVDTPIHTVRTMFLNNQSAVTIDNMHGRYVLRRKLIFDAAASVAGFTELCLHGVSLSTIANSSPSSLLTHFPDLQKDFGKHLSQCLLSQKVALAAASLHHFEPTHTFPLSLGKNATSITLRNCFVMSDDSIYAVEQISDDFGGYTRIDYLFNHHVFPCSLVLTFSVLDHLDVLGYLKKFKSNFNDIPVFWCYYSISASGEVTYSPLLPIALID